MENKQDTYAKHVYLILLIITVIWGINTPIMKLGLLSLSPLVYNAGRFLVAAALALTALFVTGAYRPMPLSDVRKLVTVAVMGFFCNQILVIFGMSLTTAGNSSLILSTLPVEVALINRLLGFEKISQRTAAGIATGFCGVLLVVSGSNQEFSLFGPHMAGAALLLAGQFCYAYYTVFSKPLNGEYSIFLIIAAIMTINAVLFLLMAWPEASGLAFADIKAEVWGSILVSSVFALFLSNFVWVWIVGIMGSTKASLSQYLCPVISIVFAWIFLGETFSLQQCIGAAVTFAGLYLTRNG